MLKMEDWTATATSCHHHESILAKKFHTHKKRLSKIMSSHGFEKNLHLEDLHLEVVGEGHLEAEEDHLAGVRQDIHQCHPHKT